MSEAERKRKLLSKYTDAAVTKKKNNNLKNYDDNNLWVKD